MGPEALESVEEARQPEGDNLEGKESGASVTVQELRE